MGRPLRYVPEGGALVEITSRTLQGRYLLRPDAKGRVNETIIGVLGRAQRLHTMSIIAVSVLSNHLHLLIHARDADQMARFMKHVNTNLSKEIGRLHDWRGRLWERRYSGIWVGETDEDQIARLRYVLAAGVKELLVDRAIEWPGVQCVRALLSDQLLRGWWFDRTSRTAAKQRGERLGRYDFASPESVTLEPLPCWRHLPPREVCRRVRQLINGIEREAAAERQRSGRRSLGPTAIMAADPHHRPRALESSPAPAFHAIRMEARAAMRQAYAWVVVEYRKAADLLRAGQKHVKFPEGTFPPNLPFVPFARGQPP